MGYNLDNAELDFGGMVAAGNITGYTARMKFGERTTVGTTEEDLWACPAVAYEGWLQVAQTVRVKAGGNGADTLAGAGARTIMVQGLDENWEEAYEVIELAGTAASASTTTKFIRQFRSFVMEVGTYGGSNVGIITIETSDGNYVTSCMEAGVSQTQQMALTIPKGQAFVAYTFDVSIDSNKSGTFRVYMRPNANNTTNFSPFRKVYTLSGIAGGATSVINIKIPLYFPEYTDVLVTIEADSIGAKVHASITGYTMPA